MSEEKQETHPPTREIKSADELTPEDLSAIKNYLERVGVQREDRLAQYLVDSLGIEISVPESGLEDGSQRLDALRNERARILNNVLQRIKDELGEIKFSK